MTHPAAFRQVEASGASAPLTRSVAIERPVALEYNGIGYAVLMATPADLGDLIHGFALSERLVESVDQLLGFDLFDTDRGTVARVTLAAERAPLLLDRVRHRVSESSCGLCGLENLEQALRPLPQVQARTDADEAAIFRAVADIAGMQPLNQATGAMHAAALCGADGAIRLVREDVGRHNALDKLIGAMARAGLGWDGGFALVSSRCSFELVEKAVLANCPMLVAISAPTDLAIRRAAQAGLRLIALARGDSYLAPPGDGGRVTIA